MGASPKCSDAGLRPRTVAPGGLGLRRAMGSRLRCTGHPALGLLQPSFHPQAPKFSKLRLSATPAAPSSHTAPAYPLGSTSSQWSRPTPGCRVTCVQSLPPNSASDHAPQGPSGPRECPDTGLWLTCACAGVLSPNPTSSQHPTGPPQGCPPLLPTSLPLPPPGHRALPAQPQACAVQLAGPRATPLPHSLSPSPGPGTPASLLGSWLLQAPFPL